MYDIDFSWALQEEGGEWKSYTQIQRSLGMWRIKAAELKVVFMLLHDRLCLSFLSCKMGTEDVYDQPSRICLRCPKSAWIVFPFSDSQEFWWSLGPEGRVRSMWGLGISKPKSLRPHSPSFKHHQDEVEPSSLPYLFCTLTSYTFSPPAALALL